MGSGRDRIESAFRSDPISPSVRRDLGKVVAHSILRRSHNRLRAAPLAAIEWDPVEIVLNLRFVRIIRVERWPLSFDPRIFRTRSSKENVFAVRTPDSIRLHKLR